MRTSPLHIGNAGGYWGDDPQALKRQVEKGHLDYISMDFLAEITMSILQKQREKNPDLGYARDFIGMLEGVLPKLLTGGTRIITNAGGINPQACAKAIQQLATKMGLNPKIAVVAGDDIRPHLLGLEQQGAKFQNMETGEDFRDVKDRICAANVYFGALPVVEALRRWEPDILITGRVTDTGITLAAMIHEFGWDLRDWDKLASGIIAGHMIECGSQVTGGNFTDWDKVPNFHEMGYPVVEVSPNGSFVLTKHEGTGGLVSVDTVREQIFYEMGNPRAYITPDVVADFTTIRLQADGPNRVKVQGIKGYEPTPFYKVSMAYYDGFKVSGSIVISGPDARLKAEKFADIFWKRLGSDYEKVLTEYLGWNACHRSLGHREDGNEILLRLSACDQSETKLAFFAKMIPSLILGGPPGVAVLGGVPKVQSVVSYWPALIPKELLTPLVSLNPREQAQEAEGIPITSVISGNFDVAKAALISTKASKPSMSTSEILKRHSSENPKLYPLKRIALARSGDKGDMANIGLLARSPKAYGFLKTHVTAQVVKDLFQELCLGEVLRYELEELQGLNFLLEQSLGGGGSCTLRTDAQGKTFAQALLRQHFAIPADVLEDVERTR